MRACCSRIKSTELRSTNRTEQTIQLKPYSTNTASTVFFRNSYGKDLQRLRCTRRKFVAKQSREEDKALKAHLISADMPSQHILRPKKQGDATPFLPKKITIRTLQ